MRFSVSACALRSRVQSLMLRSNCHSTPSGLLQSGGRFYWPEIGRFIQQDPIGDDTNSYAYAANNPLVSIDPSGLFDVFCQVEGDVVVPHLGSGLEGAVGFVYDTDRPLESGYFASGAVAVGANVGAAVGGGFALRDAEGYSANIDVNAWMGSFVFSFDKAGFNGVSVGVGPGAGASGSIGHTWTYMTIGKAADRFDEYVVRAAAFLFNLVGPPSPPTDPCE